MTDGDAIVPIAESAMDVTQNQTAAVLVPSRPLNQESRNFGRELERREGNMDIEGDSGEVSDEEEIIDESRSIFDSDRFSGDKDDDERTESDETEQGWSTIPSDHAAVQIYESIKGTLQEYLGRRTYLMTLLLYRNEPCVLVISPYNIFPERAARIARDAGLGFDYAEGRVDLG